MCTFSSHSDFDDYHQEIGEVCDYTSMKAEMMSGLSATSASDWLSIPDLDLDASWLDIGELLGNVFTGIGEFVMDVLGDL